MASFLEERVAQVIQGLREFSIPLSKQSLFEPKLPRVVKTSAMTFFDYTPNSCHAAAAYKFPNCPIQYVRQIEDLIRNEGEKKDLGDVNRRVSLYLKQKENELNKHCDFSKLFVKPWLNPDSRFALVLPTKEFGNNTGLDFLLETDELYKKLLYYFASRLVQNEDVKGADAHFIIWLFVSTIEVNPYTQIVCQDEDYKFSEGAEEAGRFAELMEKYLSLVETTLLSCNAKQLSCFASSLKPYKSLGFSNRNIDGSIFSRAKNYEVPTPECLSGFEIKDGKVNDYAVMHNGWIKTSTLPNKLTKLPLIEDDLLTRLELADKGCFDDPQTIFNLMMSDNANVSTLSRRINNPDEILWEDGSPIDSVRAFLKKSGVELLKTGRILSAASKPREACFVEDGFLFKSKISPLVYAKAKANGCDLVKKGKIEAFIGSDESNKRPWSVKFGTCLSKRIRGIMPADPKMTMGRNCYFKAIMKFLEDNENGFPSLSEKNKWFKATSLFLEQNVKGRVWYAIDLSHFETFASTNYELLLSLFGTKERRKKFIHDCAWTILAAMYEFLYATFLVASGSPVTSVSSLFMGCFIHCLILSKFSTNPMQSFEDLLIKDLYYACESLIEWCKANNVANVPANPFAELVKNPLQPWTEIQTKFGVIKVRKGQGSDDQSGCLSSDTLSDDELEQMVRRNPLVQELIKRGLLTLDTREFTSFGVKRSRDSISQDVTSLISKLFLIEFDTNSEQIMFGFYLMLSSIPGAAECLEKAVLDLKAETGKDLGDILGFYRLGAAHFIQTLDKSCKAKTSLGEMISSAYAAESPKGKAISESLKASGYDELDSLKVHPLFNECWLKTILSFNQGASIDDLKLIKKPTLQETYPNCDVEEILKKSKVDSISVADEIARLAKEGDINEKS